MDNFPDQFRLGNSDWWKEGSADYLSNVIYPTGNFEWGSWSYAEGIDLDTTLLDLSYGAFTFFQFLEWEIGREGIFRLFKGLPIKGGKREQEASLRQAHGAMDELFHDFVEALVDGSIQDSGGRRVPTPLELGQTVLDHPGALTQDIEPFGRGRRHLLVKPCKRAHLQFGKAAIKTSARPQAEAEWLDGWATQPTKIPTWPGDEHDRILVVTAVRAAQIDLEVTDVDDDPECEPDDPLAPSSEILEFCDLGCEPSDYFPPLSPPIEFGDP